MLKKLNNLRDSNSGYLFLFYLFKRCLPKSPRSWCPSFWERVWQCCRLSNFIITFQFTRHRKSHYTFSYRYDPLSLCVWWSVNTINEAFIITQWEWIWKKTTIGSGSQWDEIFGCSSQLGKSLGICAPCNLAGVNLIVFCDCKLFHQVSHLTNTRTWQFFRSFSKDLIFSVNLPLVALQFSPY